MAEKLLKRDDEPATSTTTISGMALGNIPISTLMVDKVAVDELITAAVTGGWKAGGSLEASEIVSTLLVAGNEGKVYNVSEDFTTTSDFVDGAGTTYMAGTNIAVINVATSGDPVYKFDVLGGTDQSVVRQINVGDSTQALLPTNSVVTIPAALSAAYGVVKLDDGIDSAHGLTDGFAATPSAVSAALLSAKNYVDSLDRTYELSGALDGNTFVTTMTQKDHEGTVVSSWTSTVPTALSNAAGIVKLADGTDLSSLDAAAATAATPKAVYDALTAAKSYTDTAISALDYTASGMGAGKTIATLTEEDGVISATFQDIAITQSQITDFHTGLSAAFASIGNSTPTTVSATIDLLMQVVNALKAIV